MAAGVLALFLVSGRADAGRRHQIIPFSEAELFLELNATDGDLGLHLKADGDGWKRLILTDARFHRLLDVRVKGNLGREIGLTELFSESAEPSFDEVPKDEFLALFRPGFYFFFAKTLEGPWMVGTTILTHALPGEVELVSPEEDGEVDSEEDLVVEWESLDDPDSAGSGLEFYEVVVEKDEDDERLRVFRVDMLPSDTSIRVPAEFLEEGKDYKVEIVAQETSGNRTSIEVPFETEEGDE